ncbi:DUF1294 domain-containing protein [Leifsonia sp. YIM 134122]|uniref:DUF1294 domain-containing protein n=1 Tax=Leifsonia stereocauli TaxID=3134136 RepID=A0ABU9W0K0_9MICO
MASLITVVAFAGVWIAIAVTWGVPEWAGVVYGIVGVVTFIAYWRDKRAARAARWRVSESTLLTLGLFCGWPGAIAAQQLLRHKTTKRSFRSAFWFTVAINIMFFVAVAWVIAHPEIVGG